MLPVKQFFTPVQKFQNLPVKKKYGREKKWAWKQNFAREKIKNGFHTFNFGITPPIFAVHSVFFFGREKKKVGVKALFWALFRFFHGQKLIFTPVFFGFFHFFHARIFFSRPNFGFFSRAKNKFHGQKYENFHGQFFFFTGIFCANQPTCLSLSQAFLKKKDN